MQGATDTDLTIPNHQVQNGERQLLKLGDAAVKAVSEVPVRYHFVKSHAAV